MPVHMFYCPSRHPEYGDCDTAVALHPGMVRTALAAGFFKGYGGGWLERTPLRPLVAAWNAFIDGVRQTQGLTGELPAGYGYGLGLGVPPCMTCLCLQAGQALRATMARMGHAVRRVATPLPRDMTYTVVRTQPPRPAWSGVCNVPLQAGQALLATTSARSSNAD